jgi:hypothetical protein
MTADNIRAIDIAAAKYDGQLDTVAALAFFLQEIAAQLAELNHALASITAYAGEDAHVLRIKEYSSPPQRR